MLSARSVTVPRVALLLVVGFLLPLAQPGASATTPDLAPNAGFEEGTGPLTAAWTFIATGAPAAREQADVHGGAQALFVGGGANGDVASSRFGVIGGATYVLGAWVHDRNDPVDLGVETFDAAGTSLGITFMLARRASPTWTHVAAQTSLPALATSARVVVLGATATVSAVDDVDFEILHETPSFQDDFDSLAAWTAPNSYSIASESGNSFLHITPPCCGLPYAEAIRTVALEAGANTSISIDFRGASQAGDADEFFEVIAPTGRNLVLFPTEGTGASNNGLRLVHGNATTETIIQDTGQFFAWTPGVWYTATIHLVGASVYADVHVRGSSAILATSPTLPMSGIDQFSKIRFRAIGYASGQPSFDFDALSISG